MNKKAVVAVMFAVSIIGSLGSLFMMWIAVANKKNLQGRFSLEEVTIALFTRDEIGKCFNTIKDIRLVGGWEGDMVYFGKTDVSEEDEGRLEKMDVEIFKSKVGKLDIFDEHFKKWKRVLYVDCGIHVVQNLKSIFDVEVSGKFYAHWDDYPSLSKKFKSEFGGIKRGSFEKWKNFEKEYQICLNRDHFSNSMMYFDTSIIKDSSVNDMVSLSRKWSIAENQEQSIMNLHFNCVRSLWKPMPMQIESENIPYFDFYVREGNEKEDYIMLSSI